MSNIGFKHIYEDSPNVFHIHFWMRFPIGSLEYSIMVETEEGKAVKINSGDCINSGGWYDWDECGIEEKELLEFVNEIYEGEFVPSPPPELIERVKVEPTAYEEFEQFFEIENEEEEKDA